MTTSDTRHRAGRLAALPRSTASRASSGARCNCPIPAATRAPSAAGAAARRTQLGALIDGKLIGSASLHPAERRRRAHSATIGMGVHDAMPAGPPAALAGRAGRAGRPLAEYPRLELTVWSDNTAPSRSTSRPASSARHLRKYAYRDGAYIDALTMARSPGSDLLFLPRVTAW